MNVDVIEEIIQVQALINLLEEYCEKLKKNIIIEPMDAIAEACDAGLPKSYMDEYVWKRYSHNVATAENMIVNIKEFHIPYWQSVLDELKKR